MLSSCLAMAALGHASLTEREAKIGSTFYTGAQFAHGPERTHRMTVKLPFGVTDLRTEHVPGWTATVKTGAYWSVKGHHSTSTTRVTEVTWEADARSTTSGGVVDREWFRPQFRMSFDCNLFTDVSKVPTVLKDEMKANYLAANAGKTEADFEAYFKAIDTYVRVAADTTGKKTGDATVAYFPTIQEELKSGTTVYKADSEHYGSSATPWKGYNWHVIPEEGKDLVAEFHAKHGADTHTWFPTAPKATVWDWSCSEMNIDGVKQGKSPKELAEEAQKAADRATIRKEIDADIAHDHHNHTNGTHNATYYHDEKTRDIAIAGLVMSVLAFIVFLGAVALFVAQKPAMAAA
eukprot:TRINITY_DN1207_c0_g1_i1.p1 TRINITY_DN1207_c0_g1~~TRINITY_DN1207_c0_g1_i1.p1  ORF type:complete len:349 (+),score=174.72 TRINITY_DN1207_c0_g1_i1:61-1107(+)